MFLNNPGQFSHFPNALPRLAAITALCCFACRVLCWLMSKKKPESFHEANFVVTLSSDDGVGIMATLGFQCSPESKVHRANMGPTWVLSAPDGPHVGPMNLAISAATDPSHFITQHRQRDGGPDCRDGGRRVTGIHHGRSPQLRIHHRDPGCVYFRFLLQ